MLVSVDIPESLLARIDKQILAKPKKPNNPIAKGHRVNLATAPADYRRAVEKYHKELADYNVALAKHSARRSRGAVVRALLEEAIQQDGSK